MPLPRLPSPLALLAGLLLAALPVAGCDASGDARRIAETDPAGTVLDDDPDDWQPRCADAPAAFCANPIYPNPVPAVGTVTLEFHTPVAQEVEVRISEGRFVRQRFEAGPHALTVPVSSFAVGFLRVEIDPASEGRQIEGDLRVVEP